MAEQARIQIVVMAKQPLPGCVKTRLIPDLTDQGACDVHFAMLACVLTRLRRIFPAEAGFEHKLAMPVRFVWPPNELLAPVNDWCTLDQGGGDLGDRLAHVWEQLGGGPIGFFGVDSPDLPASHLKEMRTAFEDGAVDAMVGPTFDGGYWTLAAKRFDRKLLTGIDWGTSSVYDQTISAAKAASLRVQSLRMWHDVDELDDVRSLVGRVSGEKETALRELHARITRVLKEYAS